MFLYLAIKCQWGFSWSNKVVFLSKLYSVLESRLFGDKDHSALKIKKNMQHISRQPLSTLHSMAAPDLEIHTYRRVLQDLQMMAIKVFFEEQKSQKSHKRIDYNIL